MPKELQEEVKPEFWDEPIYTTFFEIFQRDQNFYQTIFYYQKVMEFKFDGEELSLLLAMWQTAQKYITNKEQKKRQRDAKKNNTKRKNPVSKMLGR